MLDAAAAAAAATDASQHVVGVWKSELGRLMFVITGGDSFDHASGNPFIWK